MTSVEATVAGNEPVPAQPATTPSGGVARLPSLTGLRFVAAFLVFGFHVQVARLADAGPVSKVLGFLFYQGSSGVTFFFILSGFVLTWSARRSDTTTRFWQRRLAKIYPNHVVTMVVAIGLVVVSAGTLSAAVLLPNVFLLQAWFPNPEVSFGLNTVSWSLSCEAFFYALFPLLYLGIKRIPVRALWPAAVAALALVWLAPLIVNLVPGTNHYWATWLFPVARTPEFIAGMVLALVVRSGQWPRLIGVGSATALTVVVYLLSKYTPDDIQHVAVPSIPFALLIGAVAAADASGRSTVWSARWAVWLGEVSFAFYMVHQLVLRVVTRGTGTEHPAAVELGIALVALGVAVLASWALYRLVEVPGMRLLGPRRRATVPPLAPPPGRPRHAR